MKILLRDKINPLAIGFFYCPLYSEFIHFHVPAEKITGSWPEAMTILGWLHEIKRRANEKIISF